MVLYDRSKDGAQGLPWRPRSEEPEFRRANKKPKKQQSKVESAYRKCKTTEDRDIDLTGLIYQEEAMDGLKNKT